MATGSSSRARVVIVGGGFAALEAALALRALVGDGAHLTLVSDHARLCHHPSATVEAFDETPPRTYDLRQIASDLGASYHQAKLEAVAWEKRHVRLASGARLQYDSLILAIGARAGASIPGTLTFRDQRDVPLFRRLLREPESGSATRIAFALPSGSAWPLPLYELALLFAAHAERLGADAEISLVSPEPGPLAIFGPHASRPVAELLEQRGVRFRGGSIATAFGGDCLSLQFDGALKVDRVVAAPQLRARRITGIPASWWGFVPTDTFGRVEGLQDVYAAGDMTTFCGQTGRLRGPASRPDRRHDCGIHRRGAPAGPIEFRASGSPARG